jgi:hypothetical protein
MRSSTRSVAGMSAFLKHLLAAPMAARTAIGVLVAVSLAGCTSVGHRFDNLEQCVGRGGWHRTADAPANRLELLELNSAGAPVRERLSAGVPLREAWFENGSNRLMVCRYEENEQVCPVAITVEFTRASNVWSAGPTQSRTCVE